MESASPQIRFLDFSASESSSKANDFASQRKGATFILPCFLLEPGDDTRLVPNQKGIVLIVSEPKYVAMIDHIRDNSRSDVTDRPGCFVVTQLVRGEEVHSPSADALRRGALVRLQGLKQAHKLNGCVGKLLFFHEKAGRWHVDIEDGVGVKALSTKNLERLPDSTPHKTFSAWRTSADVGGRWRLAEVGVVLHLETCENVRAVQKIGGQPQSARKCVFSSAGRVSLRRLLNPEDFADGSKYLQAQVEDFDDKVIIESHVAQEDRAMQLVKDVIDLRKTPHADVSVVPDEVSLQTMVAKCGADFWKLVAFMDALLHAQVRASGVEDRLRALSSRLSNDVDLSQELSHRIKEAAQNKTKIDLSDLPPHLQEEVQALAAPVELSYFDRLRIYEAVPIQQILQSDSHGERLTILEEALLQEKQRLEAPVLDEEAPVLDVLEQSSDETEGTWQPPASGKQRASGRQRSKL